MNIRSVLVPKIWYGIVLFTLIGIDPCVGETSYQVASDFQTRPLAQDLPVSSSTDSHKVIEINTTPSVTVVSSSDTSDSTPAVATHSEAATQTQLIKQLAQQTRETLTVDASITLTTDSIRGDRQSVMPSPTENPPEILTVTPSPSLATISQKIGQYYQFDQRLTQAQTLAQATETETQETSPVTIKLTDVQLLGNTAFSTEELSETWTSLLGQSVTEIELNDLAQRLTQIYLNQGYLNSRAILKEINPKGQVVIEIKEGRLGKITIEGTDRLQDYIRQRVELGAGTPLNVKKLEEQLRLLKNDPLFESVDASLRPPSLSQEKPSQNGENKPPDENVTDLVVRVVEANPFFGNTALDNYSPPSIGAVRYSLNLGYRNPIGLGDTVVVSYRPRLENIGSSYRLDTYYQVPVNPNNGAIAFSSFMDRNKIVTDEFTPLNIRGNSDRYVLEYRQPLIRQVDEEFALSFGLSYNSGQTFALDQGIPFGFGPNAQGISETSPIIFGQDYLSRSPEGVWALRSQFRIGTGLFGATHNPSPIPDGYFFAWLAQVQRLQVINDNNYLIAQLDLQLTPNPLLPMEQFAIGGAQSVRGYRQNVLAGDNGIRLSIEDRIAIARDEENRPVFTIAPFFDIGSVWMASGNPNQIGANRNILAGLGLGLIYQPLPKLTMRLDYAPPLININIRGNNIQDDGLYLGINYDF